MENLFNQELINKDKLFDDHYIDAKVLYLYCFNGLPCMDFINHLDGEKTFRAMTEALGERIVHVHRYRWYQSKEKEYHFDTTFLVLRNNFLIEINRSYIEFLHDGKQNDLVEELTRLAVRFKERQRREPLEINLVVQNRGKLELKGMEIKRTRLDLDLFYEDDFMETEQVIRKRLNKKNDKGIVLLHGLPGTGKTTYLRYLIGKIRKRVLFLSPSIAGNLMSPDFIELLIDNPDSLLIIEDAENIIMDRKYNDSSAVSNLLNISDGLLADFLNVQMICTFNSPVTMVDGALMRKGRLIAKYEFGKLSINKAQRLSDHLGFDSVIKCPMTVAEIANQHERQQEKSKMEMIGFRREMIIN